MLEYKVYVYKEPIISSIIFKNSQIDTDEVGNILNNFAKQGWRVKTMEREIHRTLLFWSREAFIFILEKDK